MADTNFYRATVSYLLYGQTLQNVLHFIGPNADAGAQNTLANDVHTIWVNEMKFLQCDDVRYVSIRVDALGSVLPPLTKTINEGGRAGLNSFIDPTQSVVVRLRTAFPGKRGRGRVYIGGIHNTYFTNGLISVTVLNNFNARFATILGNTGFGSSPFKLAVGRKIAPHDLHEVDHMEVAAISGHQSRRNIGIGI